MSYYHFFKNISTQSKDIGYENSVIKLTMDSIENDILTNYNYTKDINIEMKKN